MKRIIICSVLAFLIIAGAATWFVFFRENNGGKKSDTTEPTINRPLGTSRVSLHFQDLDQLEQFISQTELPDDFVTPDDLSLIGEFYYWRCMSNYKGGDYSDYYYSLTIENGERIGVYIEHDYDGDLLEQSVSLDSVKATGNMMNVEMDSGGVFCRDNVYYHYVKGGYLISISWMAGNTLISIGVDSGWSEDGLPDDSMIYRLLSTSDDVFSSVPNKLAAIGSDTKTEVE